MSNSTTLHFVTIAEFPWLQLKTQDFRLFHLGCWGTKCPLFYKKRDLWISCIHFTGLLYPRVWIVVYGLKWTFSSQRNKFLPPGIRTRPTLFSYFLIKNQHWSKFKRTLALKMRITFCNDLFCFGFFRLPFFFCSQSPISLDCIRNNRSSYHSLKRLVCPALCILAVLSNPLVWTPVSLHFPH